jgi:hypothetical protein
MTYDDYVVAPCLIFFGKKRSANYGLNAEQRE